jgi:hypothetical protein
VLSSLRRRSARWETDPESARSALSAASSLVLRPLGRESWTGWPKPALKHADGLRAQPLAGES